MDQKSFSPFEFCDIPIYSANIHWNSSVKKPHSSPLNLKSGVKDRSEIAVTEKLKMNMTPLFWTNKFLPSANSYRFWKINNNFAFYKSALNHWWTVKCQKKLDSNSILVFCSCPEGSIFVVLSSTNMWLCVSVNVCVSCFVCVSKICLGVMVGQSPLLGW